MVAKARNAQRQREALASRALEVSEEERRRIAATLHDGPVQDLAAASFAASAAADHAATRGEHELAATLDSAATAVRASIGALRSLLIDIYPASLRSAGLSAALQDLAQTMRGRGPAIQLHVDEAAAASLSADQQETVFRIVQELVRNAVQHASATRIDIAVTRVPHAVEAVVTDDGVGFDPRRSASAGHFGLALVRDLATEAGATLSFRCAAGSAWRLQVPTR
jgi:signal transduction histidine kinase